MAVLRTFACTIGGCITGSTVTAILCIATFGGELPPDWVSKTLGFQGIAGFGGGVAAGGAITYFDRSKRRTNPLQSAVETQLKRDDLTPDQVIQLVQTLGALQAGQPPINQQTSLNQRKIVDSSRQTEP